MAVKCTFCNDTKQEPGIPGPCVWCEEVESVTLGTVARYTESCGEGGGVVEHASGQFVEFKDYDAALAREAALREELAALRESYEAMRDRKNSIVDLQQRLTVAERRLSESASDAARWRFFSETANELQAFPHSWGHMTPEKMDFMCDEAMRAALKPAEEGGRVVNNHIDQQGFKIKLGVAYFFVFAMPGPDVTAMVIESLNEDGTVSGWDVNFKFKVENMKPDRLWRPLKYTWADKGERRAIIEYAGESALDLTP